MKKSVGILLGIFLLAISYGVGNLESGPQTRRVETPGEPLASSLKVNAEYLKIPLYFCPNRGQMDDRVAFIVQGKEKTLYFTSEGVTFVLAKPGENQKYALQPDSPRPLEENLKGAFRGKKNGAERWVVKLDFVEANRDVRPAGENETGAVISYFKGKREDWHTGLPTHSKIVYRNLWPGIDLAYSGTFDRLKYEFVVQPGADPERIRLSYRGADRLAVDKEGRLEITTPLGSFHDGVPVAYQEAGSEKRPVSLAYKMDGFSYGFAVGEYDHALPLILDPHFMMYCGYIGGSATDYGWGIATDKSGNAYITGYTVSTETTFPETTGPDLTFNGGVADAYVAKVNSAGTALIYCGYIGGSGDDKGFAIAADASGNAYVAGFTGSAETSFPVTAGPDLYYGGGTTDAFVAKINAAGTVLDYCGYIGGAVDEAGLGIAVDTSGNAYVAGYSTSTPPNFPVAVGPDLSHNGAVDAFVGKINAGGTAFVYLGYIGGSLDDYGEAVAVDAAGNAYVTGFTKSTETTFPVSVGPDLTHNNANDAFVARVNAAGTALGYCGYIGGSSDDVGRGIAVDRWGCAYVTGYTGSTEATFPAVSGPDLTFNGNTDAFVAKVNAAGTALNYCGYIGGSGTDFGYGIAVNDSGNAYVTGQTNSSETSFPVAVFPDLIANGGTDGFVAKVNVPGTGLLYSGYIGGSANDTGSSIATDGWENVFVAGSAVSTQSTFPVLVGPDLSHNSGTDAFVAKIYSYYFPARKHAVGDFDGDGSDELAVDFGSVGVYLWDAGTWNQLLGVDSESLLPADLDGNGDDEIVADLGTNGLWVWNDGNWGQLSGGNVGTICTGDVDDDGSDELVGGFGTSGLWLWDGGVWSQLSGARAEFIIAGDLDGIGGQEIIADFGTVGMWKWNGAAWTQLSGVNADSMVAGNADGSGGEDLLGDFGPIGLWLFSAGSWTQLSRVNADNVILADVDQSGDDELFGDFAFTGLWLWESGAWDILSGLNLEFMIAADTDGDGACELAGDFGSIGVWLWDGGSWSQISGVNSENLMSGDTDGDNAAEIIADFGSLGLWLWDAGSWTLITPSNPD